MGLSTTVSRSFVYGSFLLYVLIEPAARRDGIALADRPAPACCGSLQFFFFANLGTWATENLYPHTVEGLLACFVAGLPFYSYTLLGDLGYSAVLFGLHALLSRTAFPADAVPALAD